VHALLLLPALAVLLEDGIRPGFVMLLGWSEVIAGLALFLMKGYTHHENGNIAMRANVGCPPEDEALLKSRGPRRLVGEAPLVAHGTMTERRVGHIHDVAAVSG